MKKLLVLMCGLVISGAVFADTASNSSVPLTGGSIPGGQSTGLAISLNGLYPNILYKVTCSIANPSFTNAYVMINAAYGNPMQTPLPTYEVNGTFFTNAAALSHQKANNNFVATNMENIPGGMSSNTLTINNLNSDSSVVITVANCVARSMAESAKPNTK